MDSVDALLCHTLSLPHYTHSLGLWLLVPATSMLAAPPARRQALAFPPLPCAVVGSGWLRFSTLSSVPLSSTPFLGHLSVSCVVWWVPALGSLGASHSFSVYGFAGVPPCFIRFCPCHGLPLSCLAALCCLRVHSLPCLFFSVRTSGCCSGCPCCCPLSHAPLLFYTCCPCCVSLQVSHTLCPGFCPPMLS